MRTYAISSPSIWKRPLALTGLLLFVEAQLALAGNDAPATGTVLVDTSFQCHAETNGTRHFPAPGDASSAVQRPCFYRLYATRCDAPSTRGSATGLSCRTDSLAEFTLRPGETKTVTKLPAGYRYCASLQAAPTLEECMRNPMP